MVIGLRVMELVAGSSVSATMFRGAIAFHVRTSIAADGAVFIQAPAQDPLVCSSTRQCWLQLWVSCTVVRRCCDCTASSAPTTNVETRLDSRANPDPTLQRNRGQMWGRGQNVRSLPLCRVRSTWLSRSMFDTDSRVECESARAIWRRRNNEVRCQRESALPTSS